MRAVITLDDTEGGAFETSACYEGGFNLEAPAHVAAAMLMKHLHTLAEPQGEEVVFGGAPSARDAIQSTKPEDAIPSGIILDVSNEEAHRAA